MSADERVPLLEVEHLTTRFATDRGQLTAVDDVSLTLDRGEMLGIVGESGSGKSVLARTLMNIAGANSSVTPQTRIRFEGRDLRNLSKEETKHFWGKEIAMIFQNPMTSLNPVRQISRQLTEPMRYHLGLSKREAQDRAVELLRLVGISSPGHRMSQYPHQLSGGMRQRVMIAIALSCEPKLLVADEPTTALDVTVQKQILDLLAKLQDDLGMAMILITHDLGVVAGRAHRIAVMYAGQVMEESTTKHLFEATSHPYTESLLKAIPRLSQPSHTRLAASSGALPDLVNVIDQCRFVGRCPLVEDICTATMPKMASHRPGHSVRCYLPLTPATVPSGTNEDVAEPEKLNQSDRSH
jgi:peptide/nickel transport system ATP-binding protein